MKTQLLLNSLRVNASEGLGLDSLPFNALPARVPESSPDESFAGGNRAALITLAQFSFFLTVKSFLISTYKSSLVSRDSLVNVKSLSLLNQGVFG